MPPKLILHIGCPKTGTTTLQKWLYENRDFLLESGIYLPTSIGSPNNRCLSAAFDPQKSMNDGIVSRFCTAHSLPNSCHLTFKKKVLEAFENEAKKVSSDFFIITSEHFHQLLDGEDSVVELSEFLHGFFDSILVVCSFREQYSMCRSRYFTALKMGKSQPFYETLRGCSLNSHPYNHLNSARLWSSVFGKDNFCAEVYSPESASNAVENFLNASGLADRTKGLKLDIPRANKSPGHSGLILLRQLNALFKECDGFTAEQQLKLRHLLLEHPISSHGHFHNQKEAVRIFKEFSDSNAEFGREFLALSGNPFVFAPEVASESLNIPLDEVADAFTRVLRKLA